MKYSSFSSPELAHKHSTENLLSELYRYDDFMDSVESVVELGCQPDALDLKWWADATTRDEAPIPLNIKCTAVNDLDKLDIKHKSISFVNTVPEKLNRVKRPFDILWCVDYLQTILNPYEALSNWWHIANKDAMLVLAVPQTTNIAFNVQEYNVELFDKHHFTMPLLLYMLAVSGWDCKNGFFRKKAGDQWLYAVVYKGNISPMDPNKQNLYNLIEETDLLPDCAVQSITKYGKLRQRDLILPWLDKSSMWMEQQ